VGPRDVFTGNRIPIPAGKKCDYMKQSCRQRCKVLQMHHLSGEDHIKDLVTVVQNILLVIMSQVNKGKFLSIILQVLNVTVTVFEYTVISIKSFMTYVHDFITSSF